MHIVLLQMQGLLKTRKFWIFAATSPSMALGEPAFADPGTRRRQAPGAIWSPGSALRREATVRREFHPAKNAPA